MALLTADVSPLRGKLQRVTVPGMFSVSPLKLATPATALTVSVPPERALPGLVARATVSLPLKPVARFPSASSAVTVIRNRCRPRRSPAAGR